MMGKPKKIVKSPPDVLGGYKEMSFGKDEAGNFDRKLWKKLDKVTESWGDEHGRGDAKTIAWGALQQATNWNKDGSFKGDLLTTPEGEPVCFSAFYYNTHNQGKPDQSQFLHLNYLAAKPKTHGNGTVMMAELIRKHVKPHEGMGVELNAIPEAEGYYQKLGMKKDPHPVKETDLRVVGGHLPRYTFTHKQAVEFSDRVFKEMEQWKKEMPPAKSASLNEYSWLAEIVGNEPSNGVLAGEVSQQERKEARIVERIANPLSYCKCRRVRAVSGLPSDSTEEMGGFHQVVQREPEQANSSLPGDETQIGEGMTPSQKDGVRGRVSFKLIRLLTADQVDYRYDPHHENKPAGPGWQETDKGWTTVKEQKPQVAPTQQPVPTKQPEAPTQAPVKHLQENELKHRTHLKKEELHKILGSGYYSIVSGGRNGQDPKEKALKPDDPFFQERNLSLRDDLERAGLKYTEVVGHYDEKDPSATESSFLVFHDGRDLTPKTANSFMVHHRGPRDFSATRTLDRLGEKYNQDSVLHSRAGRNLVVFTTGKHRGKKCGGKGWKEAPEAKNFYTDIPLEGTDHTKARLDIHECQERNMFAMIREAVKLALDKATYRHDPKHHHRPLGPGWRNAPKGWSRIPMNTPPGPKPQPGAIET
jgi:hypothetical protein